MYPKILLFALGGFLGQALMSELTSFGFRWREKAFFQKDFLASALAGRQGRHSERQIHRLWTTLFMKVPYTFYTYRNWLAPGGSRGTQ